jgi:uncharacterized protein
MNAQEQQMLQGLVERVNRTSLVDKDADAEQLIQQTLGQNPDALYVLAQTVLVQGYALQQGQRQIADLRGQLEQARMQEPKHAGSFLGNLLGQHDGSQPAATAPPPPLTVQRQYSGGGYGPGLEYPSGGYPIAGEPPAGGGFLRSALQTATGVAAGALAFEGIESLMHGFGHAAGYGADFGGIGGGRPEEVINNYYGDDSSREHTRDAGSRFDDASYVTDRGNQQDDQITNSDDVSGTTGTDYSSQGDDSMLADNVGSDADGDFGGGDSSNF